MTPDTAAVLAAIVLVMLWPVHLQFELRALRHSLRRQRDQLAQHRRAIVQLQGAAIQPPTSVGQPMPIIGRPLATGGVISASSAYRLREGECDYVLPTSDPDPTLRLARPPALSDVAAAILGAGRPLTRATLDAQLDRDTRTEIRHGLLAGTLQMVRTHDDEPAYWPTGHPVPGDTVRMAKMPVLPGLARP